MYNQEINQETKYHITNNHLLVNFLNVCICINQEINQETKYHTNNHLLVNFLNVCILILDNIYYVISI